jgi:predicted membrane channel-forming protein YqfA (hemolysin III family)
MGLSNKVQAALVAISAALLVFGTATATIPAGISEPTRAIIAVAFWAAGIIGLALKEAAGTMDGESKPPPAS